MPLSIKKTSFECTWNIRNISLSAWKKQHSFFSPPFKSEAFENTEWYLKLTPNAGNNDEVTVEVARKCLGKSMFTILDYDLSFIAADGTVLSALKIVNALKSEFPVEGNLFNQPAQIVGNKNGKLLYQDELTVRLKIWAQITALHVLKPDYCFARTVLRKMKFPWNITNMFAGILNDKDSTLFKLPTRYFTVTLDEFKLCSPFLIIRFNILATDGKTEDFAHCKITVMDVHGKGIALFDFFTCCEEKELTFQIRTKLEYLVQDMLRMEWEFTFGIDRTVPENTRDIPDQSTFQTSTSKNTGVYYTTLQQHLLQLYNDKMFCDVTLCAGDKSFPVHKNILCARSKVFHEMFSERSQPTEHIVCLKRGNVFDVNNLQPDILEQMLLYIYTDNFPDMQWLHASYLYDAACTYGIQCLKLKCRSILKFELSVSNVCKILFLADAHRDTNLLECAWNFICKHDEVVGTEDWLRLKKCKSFLTEKLISLLEEK